MSMFMSSWHELMALYDQKKGGHVFEVNRELGYCARVDTPEYSEAKNVSFQGDHDPNVVTSLVPEGQTSSFSGFSSEELEDGGSFHMPVLDIDFPAALVPSSTPGHYHLYLNRKMTWKQYRLLLWVLSVTGIIEQGFYAASVKRGYSAARLPWARKPAGEKKEGRAY